MKKDIVAIWTDQNREVYIIDQRFLPFEYVEETLSSIDSVINAIKNMHLRGAPLIGVAAAYGIYLLLKDMQEFDNVKFRDKVSELIESRPTAVNLEWAINIQLENIKTVDSLTKKRELAWETAVKIHNEDQNMCYLIGENGLKIIEEIASHKPKGSVINILTHCNAGALATSRYGTATSPIYQAAQKGYNIHVWVDETRPRNQGSFLTAWELSQGNIPHTVITDNVGGLLMQRGDVDVVFVGSDRVTANGDVINKVGTYLKALAAFDNQIPFYALLPKSTIDFSLSEGLEVPIEERSIDEIKYIMGKYQNKLCRVQIGNNTSNFVNYGFDVTPARFITGIITEKGICKADTQSIKKLYQI